MRLPSPSRRAFVVLILLLAGATIWWLVEGRQPRHRGRPLRVWVAQLHATSLGQTNEAFDAILEMGPSTLAPLVAELKRQDTYFSRSYAVLLRTLPRPLRSYLPVVSTPSERRMSAAWALGQIGSAAGSTAPALLVALEDPEEKVRYFAAEAFRYLGVRTPEVIAALARHLTDPSLIVRSRAAEALSAMAPKSVAVLPQLTALLHDPGIAYHGGICLRELGPLAANAIPDLIDTVRQGVAGHPPNQRFPRVNAREDASAHHRAMACLALGKIGVPSPEVLAILEEGLRYTNSWVLENAAIGLASFGTNATPATATLIQSLGETNLRARVEVINALGAIGPAAAAALPLLKEWQTNTEQSLALRLRVAEQERWGIYWLRAAAIRAIARIDPADESVPASFLDFAVGDSQGRQILSRHPAAPKIVPELTRRLATNTAMSACLLAEFLSRIDPNNAAALNVLERSMASPHSPERAYAAYWHWKVTGDAPPTLKVLIDALQEPASGVSQSFPQWLREMGPAARPAVPALRKALWHPDLYARRNAALALEKIEGN